MPLGGTRPRRRRPAARGVPGVTVYVDDVRHQFGNMVMCHLWADSLDELLAMVDRIGVQRKWIQGHETLSLPRFRKASWVHFDISLSKKELAIKAGAVLTDKYGPVEHVARLDIASGNQELVAYGQKKLADITAIRARDGAKLRPDGSVDCGR